MFSKFYLTGLAQTINLNGYFEKFYKSYAFKEHSMTFSHIVWQNQYHYAIVNIYLYHGKFEEYAEGYLGRVKSMAKRFARYAKRLKLTFRDRWTKPNYHFMRLVNKSDYTEIRKRTAKAKYKRYVYRPKFLYLPYVLKLRRLYQSYKYWFRYLTIKLKRDISIMLGKPAKVQLCFVPSHYITTDICMRYIKLRLEQFNRFNEIVYPLIRTLKGRMPFIGLRIRCAGRISRQQRASFHQATFGHTSFNTYSYPLEFSYGIGILKYGVASIRIWLYRKFPIKKNSIHFKFNRIKKALCSKKKSWQRK
jgi:hypothetical protein